MPGEHAKLSPSGASRWMACTPSARLEEEFPNTTSVYAEEGTFAHDVCEKTLKCRHNQITDKEFQDYLKSIQDNEFFSESLIDYCDGYVDFVSDYVEEGDVIMVEQRLDMSNYVPDGFGTGDAIIIKVAERKLIFCDLKYGKGVPVSAINNPQLKLYALGALNDYGFIYDIEEVEVAIYQPRIDNISTWEISVEDLIHWAETEVKDKAQMAFKGEGEFVPGKHCGFCRAQAKCRALHDYNMDMAVEIFKNADLLTDKELLTVALRKPLFESWLKAVHQHLLDEAKAGKKFEGWKLVHGRGSRKYANIELVVSTLKEKGHTNIFAEPKLLGITELTKKLGKKEFDAIVDPLMVKSDGKPTLVEASDKRPEIASVAEAADVFEDETGDDLI